MSISLRATSRAALCIGLLAAGCRSRPAGGTPNGGAADRWVPAPGTSWQWQLSGTLDTSFDVAVYDVDLFETPAPTIAALQAAGRKVVCYLNAGAYEIGRPDSADLPEAARGNVLDGWPDERWLDTRSQAVRGVMKARLDRAASAGCDGVEPDNVDAYANASGFPLTAATQLDYNRFLAAEAHARGLSVALKNDLEQVAALVGDFDFAVVEECVAFAECPLAAPFVTAGKAVFAAEYGGSATAAAACPTLNALDFDGIVKNSSLDAFRIACR